MHACMHTYIRRQQTYRQMEELTENIKIYVDANIASAH